MAVAGLLWAVTIAKFVIGTWDVFVNQLDDYEAILAMIVGVVGITIEPFAVAVAMVACALGLWRRHKWARMMFLCVGGLHLIWLISSQLFAKAMGYPSIGGNSPFSFPWLGLIVFTTAILYLYLRVPKTYFREASPTAVIPISKS